MTMQLIIKSVYTFGEMKCEHLKLQNAYTRSSSSIIHGIARLFTCRTSPAANDHSEPSAVFRSLPCHQLSSK